MNNQLYYNRDHTMYINKSYFVVHKQLNDCFVVNILLLRPLDNNMYVYCFLCLDRPFVIVGDTQQ